MRSGGLNRKITLASNNCEVVGRDEFNAPIYAAPVVIGALAEYEPISDGEKLSSGEVAASLSARFRVRWSPTMASVTPRWLLTFECRTFNIVGVKEVGHREAIEITAAARAE